MTIKRITTWMLIISMLLLTVLPSMAAVKTGDIFSGSVILLADKGSSNDSDDDSDDDSDNSSSSSSSSSSDDSSKSGRDPNKIEDSPFHHSSGHAYGWWDDSSERNKERAWIRTQYTAQELEALLKLGAQIKVKYRNVNVLGVDQLILSGKEVKFDTPPVIKDGRMLIPVRALSTAYGATVSWTESTKMVTIIKGDKKIEMKLGDDFMMVTTTDNTKTPPVSTTEKIMLDVPAESMNGRTVVPIKFIVEQLGLKVQWNDSDDTVVVTDPTKQPVGTTTPSALTPTTP